MMEQDEVKKLFDMFVNVKVRKWCIQNHVYTLIDINKNFYILKRYDTNTEETSYVIETNSVYSQEFLDDE